ncbi:amidase [Aquipluma nitroreducens]|uniref:Amidase n=1 Tax=Aquipluma nitroreducens TaxID=2010828 RepID=A0A5K7S8N6_9BACT|nr:amidase [Aquipluma nitroreducens]BBE17923.1 amidase [Aquipluma nitroreducens]
MKRRNFFKTAALGGGTLAFAPLSSCVQSTTPASAPEDYSAFELNEVTIAQLQEKMSSGALSSVEITRKYLDRIERIDKKGPELHSVIEINPDALDIARQLDDERKSGKIRGPLHGIPILIKDNIDTGDRMQTTAGSLALVGAPAPDDAIIVRKLREAGVVLLGKTNLSEWANFRSTHSSSGWSGRGGQVRNPFCTDRSPCGSSSGTGAAVSANLCAIGIGTETDGSIVCPSGINGIVGIKPTVGLWSGDGIIPISHSQDTAGPMARTVSDAAILLGALSEKSQDYSKALDINGLRNARIGIASDFFGFHSGVEKLMADAIQTLKTAGAIIVEDLKFENQQEWGKLEWQVLISEFKADLNAYLKSRTGLKVQSLSDLIEFNKQNADTELKWFAQEIFEDAEKTKGLEDPVYLEALSKVHEMTRKNGIDLLMDKHQLDALIAPTNGPSWTIDLVNGDHFGGGSSEPAAISGYPNISVPAGYVQGLPVGISFFGRAWSEATLIKLAFAYEQASKHRKAPGFLKSIF